MDKRRFRIVLAGLAAIAIIAAYAPSNRADIRILAHEQSDPNPHQIRAAIDIGLVAVSLLVTWTGKFPR